MTPETILEQLEKLYDLALSQDNLAIALRIKELQAKSLNSFKPDLLPNLLSLPNDHLKALIKQLEGDLKPS